MVDSHKKAIYVLVAHPNGALLAQRLQNELPFVHVEYHPTHSVNDVKESVWRECEVLYTEKALPLPEQVPNLRWIHFHYAGIDYSLDAPLLKKSNLIITTLSGVPALPMGEYVISYILAIGHRIFEMKELQNQRYWPNNRFDVLYPSETEKVHWA